MNFANKIKENNKPLTREELLEWANFLYGRYQKRKELQKKQQKRKIMRGDK